MNYLQLSDDRVKDLETIKRGLIKLAIDDELPLDMTRLDMQYVFMVGAIEQIDDTRA